MFDATEIVGQFRDTAVRRDRAIQHVREAENQLRPWLLWTETQISAGLLTRVRVGMWTQLPRQKSRELRASPSLSPLEAISSQHRDLWARLTSPGYELTDHDWVTVEALLRELGQTWWHATNTEREARHHIDNLLICHSQMITSGYLRVADIAEAVGRTIANVHDRRDKLGLTGKAPR